jgi:hypothetical protein
MNILGKLNKAKTKGYNNVKYKGNKDYPEDEHGHGLPSLETLLEVLSLTKFSLKT